MKISFTDAFQHGMQTETDFHCERMLRIHLKDPEHKNYKEFCFILFLLDFIVTWNYELMAFVTVPVFIFLVIGVLIFPCR